jgi:beta-N-acetylhexosaminidase
MTVRACITSISGPDLLTEEARFLREAQPWGVILMGRSCQTRPQVRQLVLDIHDALGREALIFIDQEGGRVARLRPPVWPAYPAAAVYGDLFARDRDAGLAACRLGHRLIAHDLYELGVRANCAPVCDLHVPETHQAIGDRAFASAPDSVIALAGAALDGLGHGGVLGVLKHMPGQGRARVDSHHDLPRIEASAAELELDFSVFAGLADRVVMGMTGHVAYEALAPGHAATISVRVISEVIRGRIGSDSLLMTDDLGMQALGGRLSNRGQRAREAGCDVLLHCSGFLSDPAEILSEMQEIAEAAGPLEGEAARRAARVEAALPTPDGTDMALAREKLVRLLAGQWQEV